MDCRLIVDSPADGSVNMACDEMLLHAINETENDACLRFYQWRKATLSLGYFQSHADRKQHGASTQCPLVRRSTGGGAIIHDTELTYSFVTSARSHAGEKPEMLYDAFHETLVQELGQAGITARLCPESSSIARQDQPFLCFERRSRGDVLVGETKIAGSAQRRFRNRVLQHGSILLKRSNSAPELAGIWELTSICLDPIAWARQWSIRLAARLGLSLKPDTYSPEELIDIRRFATEKYATMGWTQRR